MKKVRGIISFVMAFCIALSWLSFSAFAQTLDISAKSAVLIEAESGDLLYQKNAFTRLPMASTTKIMTAIVAIESCDLSKTIAVPKEAVGVEGSSVYLHEGERLTMENLLYALLLESANDAATAIAILVGGSIEGFADMMNRKAAELELTGTHFTNPHGLDDGEHYTTAFDLAKIAAYALKNEDFSRICSTYRTTIPLNSNEGTRVLVNHNKMLRIYNGAIGIKTGFTKKSGRCLVSAAKRDGLTLVAVTLNAPNDWSDHEKLLNFGFDRYERVRLARVGEFSTRLDVTGGSVQYVIAKNNADLSCTLSRDHGEITCIVETTGVIYAPVNEGDVVGRVVYKLGNNILASSDLVATYNVKQSKQTHGFWESLRSFFASIFT